MWEEIGKNKRNSYLLIAVTAGLLLLLGYVAGLMTDLGYWALVVAGAIALVMSLIAYFSGDSVLLAMSKARRVEKQDSPQLYNVVEELCIASGLPLPKIYIIDTPAPNAFAAGRNPQRASVAVTTGLLQKLDRYELQGVIGHELSHVRNYDILYATMVGVLVGAIAILADIMLRIRLYGRMGRRRSGGGQAEALIMIVGLILAIVAPLSAKLLQLAASRRREYLADASSVEMTRYPEGLASALEKIASNPFPLGVPARATQHLYIVNPLKAIKVDSLFSTHPPIVERIRRLRAIAGVPPDEARR